jgi:hypothetical protein
VRFELTKCDDAVVLDHDIDTLSTNWVLGGNRGIRELRTPRLDGRVYKFALWLLTRFFEVDATFQLFLVVFVDSGVTEAVRMQKLPFTVALAVGVVRASVARTIGMIETPLTVTLAILVVTNLLSENL